VALWRATVDIVDLAMVGCAPSPSTPPPHRRRCSLGRRGYYRESTILSGHLAGGSVPCPLPTSSPVRLSLHHHRPFAWSSLLAVSHYSPEVGCDAQVASPPPHPHCGASSSQAPWVLRPQLDGEDCFQGSTAVGPIAPWCVPLLVRAHGIGCQAPSLPPHRCRVVSSIARTEWVHRSPLRRMVGRSRARLQTPPYPLCAHRLPWVA
jgi:hypothetical protein